MNTLSSASTAPMRELTNEEVDEVSGGALPLLVVGVAILIAAAMQESGGDSSSENEESEGNESDN